MRFSSVLKAFAVLLPIGLGVAAPAEAAPPAKSLLTPDNLVSCSSTTSRRWPSPPAPSTSPSCGTT